MTYNMADYKKVFIRGWATMKTFDWGKVMKVSINVDELMEKIRSKELSVSETGNIFFDIVEKKPEKQQPGENTHYLVQSQKIADSEQPRAGNPASDDLPF